MSTNRYTAALKRQADGGVRAHCPQMKTLLLAGAAVFAGIALGCGKSAERTASVARQDLHDTVPVMFVYQVGAHPLPLDTSPRASGLYFALWEDRQMIRATSIYAQSYELGRGERDGSCGNYGVGPAN